MAFISWLVRLVVLVMMLGWGASCSSPMADQPPVPRPIRILPVGDSITQGGKRDRDEYTYRLPLQRLLRAEGVAYDFIGSRQAGLQPEATWPEVVSGVPFDPDHEGYYGAKTAVVCARVEQALSGFAAAPDFVLIHLGTNDQKSADFAAEVIKPLRQLIARLRDRNSRVVILLGHLNFNEAKGALVLRPLVEALAQELSTPDSPVMAVPHYLGWHERPREPNSDTFDWAHPNEMGQSKMAQAWWAAMRPWLRR
jgi:lysophospholipase L1-like esterase